MKVSCQEYRHRASECARLAKQANNTEIREILLYLAKRWATFAADAASELNQPEATRVPGSHHEELTMTAAHLRAEAKHLRMFALTVTDPAALAEIGRMIAELERRARVLGNGNAGGDDGNQPRESDWIAARAAAVKRHVITVDGPIAAAGPGSLHWSRWRIETEDQFRERVLDAAAQLEVHVTFEEQESPRPEDPAAAQLT